MGNLPIVVVGNLPIVVVGNLPIVVVDNLPIFPDVYFAMLVKIADEIDRICSVPASASFFNAAA